MITKCDHVLHFIKLSPQKLHGTCNSLPQHNTVSPPPPQSMCVMLSHLCSKFGHYNSMHYSLFMLIPNNLHVKASSTLLITIKHTHTGSTVVDQFSNNAPLCLALLIIKAWAECSHAHQTMARCDWATLSLKSSCFFSLTRVPLSNIDTIHKPHSQ